MNWYHFQFWFRPPGLTDTSHIMIHCDALGHDVEEAGETAKKYLRSIIQGGLITLNFAGHKTACCCYCPRED